MTFGLSAENILLPFLYIILPFLPVIFSVAYLFAVVTVTARLSVDGEITALQSKGLSLLRFALAPLLIGVVVSAVSTACAIYFESWGRREFVQFVYRKTHIEIDNVLHTKLQPGVFLHDFLDYVLYAEKISADRTTLSNVLVASSRESRNKFVLLARQATMKGSIVGGDLKVRFSDGFIYTLTDDSGDIATSTFKAGELDLLEVFHKEILGNPTAEDDFRSYPPAQLWSYVASLRAAPQGQEETLAKAEYLWHSRWANSLVVISFALLGVILGLHDPRSVREPIFIKSVATVIFSMSWVSLFRWLAEHSLIDAIWAAWLPQLLLLGFSVFALLQRNRLPATQSLWSRVGR